MKSFEKLPEPNGDLGKTVLLSAITMVSEMDTR